MNTISISQLKVSPSKAIQDAADWPLAIENRNNIEAYLIGRDLYEKLVAYIENSLDRQAIDETDFKKGRDFESLARELSL